MIVWDTVGHNYLPVMGAELEGRKQEFLAEQLESKEMDYDGCRQLPKLKYHVLWLCRYL